MKKSFVNQEGFKDCGPACLLMIIKHYKGYIELDELKEMCKTNKLGTSAYDLIETAKEIGFEAYGVKCKLESMNINNMILPCIAHVIIDNSYSHYVVIEKINYKKKKILIKDPANKFKYLSFEEFEKIYNDILIFLYPIKKIPYNEPHSFYDFIKKIINSSTKQLIETIIISLIITFLSIIFSFYLQCIFDNIDFGKNKIILIFIIFLIINILKIISDYFRNKILIIVNEKINLELTNETFKKIILLPYCYYRNNTTGEIISKIDDLDVVRQIISKAAISLFIDFPLTIITLIVMYIINHTLFLVSLIIMLLYLFITLIFNKPLNKNINECQIKKANTTSFMVESINGFESVKGSNLSKKIIEKFEYKYINMLNNLVKFDDCYNLLFLFKELINGIGYLIIIFIGAILVIENKLTIGSLLSFTVLFNYFLEPIRNIIDLDSSLKQSKNAIKRIQNMFLKENKKYILDKQVQGDIKIQNLNYKFDDNIVLNDINLDIKKGKKVMVIGNSGGGKSTLFKILKKYYPIERNKVFINNIDINDYKESDIVYISQNEILFTDTILNNIGSLDNVNTCLIDEIVKNSPIGFNTLIEENGFNISGGEKQRIILARALNNNFNILIIDEGLNQVDINMERIIIKNLFHKYYDKTIIIISHRYDNMDLFDQVIKIEKGVIQNVQKNR